MAKYIRQEDAELVAHRSFCVSMDMWQDFWKEVSIESVATGGMYLPRDFFTKMVERYEKSEEKKNPPFGRDISREGFEQFIGDFKRLVEQTKNALGELYYDDVVFDEEDEQ